MPAYIYIWILYTFCLCVSRVCLSLVLFSWSATADHFSSLKRLWRTRGLFLSSWSVSIYESTGLRHRKGWWGNQSSRVKQSCCICTMKVSKRSTAFSASHSQGCCFFVLFFFSFSFWTPALQLNSSLPNSCAEPKGYRKFPVSRSPQETPLTSWCVSPPRRLPLAPQTTLW